MKIDNAIGRPGRKLFQVIVDDVVRSDDGHFPAELGATPRPIKIDIGKWKIFLIESIAFLPRFTPNQERASENRIARAPTNSVADLPGRIVRSVQIQSCSQILSERERQRRRKPHSIAKKAAVVLLDGEAGGSKLRFQLEKCDRFFQWFRARQAIVRFIKEKPSTSCKTRNCRRAARVNAVAKRATRLGGLDDSQIICRIVFAPRF